MDITTKETIKKYVIAIIGALALVFGAFSANVFAVSVPYVNADGTPASCADATVLTGTDTTTTVLTSGCYVVDGWTHLAGGRTTVSGDVVLILTDGSFLINNSGFAVLPGNSLTIYSQSFGVEMGTLFANVAGGNAAVGQSFVGDSLTGGGDITINGGNITVTGGAVGMLSSPNGAIYGNVTINNGVVTATGNADHYGGGDGIGGTVAINGGTVTAIGGDSSYDPGAGISGLVSLPKSYTYWVNTTTADPGGEGTVFSNGVGVPFVNNSSYRFVRIVALDDTDDGNNGEDEYGEDNDNGLKSPESGVKYANGDASYAIRSNCAIIVFAVVVVFIRMLCFFYNYAQKAVA